VVDTRRHSVRVGENAVTLIPTEFRLLATMIREPGRTFNREQLIDQVLGYDFDGFDRTVDAHVSSLRRKIEAGGRKQRYIHTVYGVGYRFGDA
jgi:DNA-binding response OmpR family regulator